MMTREFRDAWTAKLRSGEYTQAKGRLAKSMDSQCRCCLGVAYAVADQPVPMSYPGVADVLPLSSDLDHWGLDENIANDLANRNDGIGTYHDWSFAQIADYIDTLPVAP